MRYLALLPFLFMLSGCVTVISDQTRTIIDPGVKYAEVQSSPDKYLGKNVLVGGRILASTSTNEVSSMELQQLNVDGEGFPVDLAITTGRYIAESTTFYDPTLYKPGRIVTLVGEVTGKRSLPVEGTPYLYPVLTIKEIYLWDPEKFGGRNTFRDANPYSNTYDQPLIERPLSPKIIIR